MKFIDFYNFLKIYLIASYRKPLHCIIWGLILYTHSIIAQTIPCDGAYYLFLTPHSGATTSAMYRVTKKIDTELPVFELINPNVGHRVTAAGYSVGEQMIYALDYNTLNLLKIDAKGRVEILPVPARLDTTNLFFAGEVSPGGGNLLVVGRDKKQNKDLTLFSIRLFQEDFFAGRVSILSDFAATLEDLAFDPVRGTLYGYNSQNNKIVWVNNLSGRIEDYFSRNMSGVALLGSLMFDRNGFLHAYGSTGSNEESTFFDIDKLQGRAEALDQGPIGRFSDGCACPYTIRSYKNIQPRQALPCEELKVTYDIINHAGTAYSYLSFRDTFPPGFVIKKILKTTRTGTIVSGEGTNVIAIDNIDLILDTNRVIITLEVNENVLPGIYSNRALLAELPAAIGKNIWSDDPHTTIPLDATNFEILSNESKGVFIKQEQLCNGNGLLLKSNIKNATYQWSNGASSESILVRQPGWYALTITADCGVFRDSIEINVIANQLNVQLPVNEIIELGDSVRIKPIVNTNRNLFYQWQASDSATIACPNCTFLAAKPKQSTLYFLTVKDENGCDARAFVPVTVIPRREIFTPTAFSPNEDGINDVFYLQSKSNAKINYLRIFDRWGNQVFQVQNGFLNDPNFGWDGKVNFQNLPGQSFIFIAEVEFEDGIKKRLSGEISLLK